MISDTFICLSIFILVPSDISHQCSEGGTQKKTLLPEAPIKDLGQRTMDRLNTTKCRPLIRPVTETPLRTTSTYMVCLGHQSLTENLNESFQLKTEFKIQDKHKSCKQ